MVTSLQETWKLLQRNTLHEGTLSADAASVQSVEWLAKTIGVQDVKSPDWSKALLTILTKASSSQDVSERIAATGIARSFRILGTWGYLLAKNPEEAKLCELAVKVGGVYLRSLSGNFLVRFADWLREKISFLLLKRSVLPSEFQESYNRKDGRPARKKEGFDAVVTFADAGIRGELIPIEAKIKAKQISYFGSFLRSIERFIRDVFPTSLSTHEEVARLQMLWRILTREVDGGLGHEEELSALEMKRLKNYVWQYQDVIKVLESHRQRGHWIRGKEMRPHTFVKRVLHGQSQDDLVMKIMQRAEEAELIKPGDSPLVIHTTL